MANRIERNKAEFIAQHGSDKHREKLMNHPDPQIRADYVSHAPEHHLDKMIHDPDYDVRTNIAYRRNPKHLDHLINDPNSMVRMAVAINGHDRHLEKLKDDPSPMVSDHAKKVLSRHSTKSAVWHEQTEVSLLTRIKKQVL